MTSALVRAATEDHANQYSRSAGDPLLTHALSKYYSPLLFSSLKTFKQEETKRENIKSVINPLTEITICVGASEALYAVILSFIEPGDEVVVFEPCFDLYAPQIQMAGGQSVYVPIIPPNPQSFYENRVSEGTSVELPDWKWELDADALRAAITPQTRAIIVNTPHNPTGYMFSSQDMESIRDIVRANERIMVICDEVYEHLCYFNHCRATPCSASTSSNSDADTNQLNSNTTSGVALQHTCLPKHQPHIRFASLPDMWYRTVTISSSGKTFSNTGWKIGWCIGPQELIQPIKLTNQWVQFSVNSPCQRAMGHIFNEVMSTNYSSSDVTTMHSGGVKKEKDSSSELGKQISTTYPNYYDYILSLYTHKLNLMISALAPLNRLVTTSSSSGSSIPLLIPYVPSGTFFLICNVTGLIHTSQSFHTYYNNNKKKDDPVIGETKINHTDSSQNIEDESDDTVLTIDWYFCRWLCIEVGVAAIPMAAFYSKTSRKRLFATHKESKNSISSTSALHLIRLCFAKDDDVLMEGCKRLCALAADRD